MSATEIQLDQETGMCRVMEGAARRVFYTSADAVGLALLNLQGASQTSALQWTDCLTQRGVAFGSRGDDTYILMINPAQSRQVAWRRRDDAQELTLNLPPLFWTMKFHQGKLNRAGLYVIKPGWETKLHVGLADRILCFFPYGNVYNHGGVCWGEIAIRDLRQPLDVEQAFFASGFNGDLFASGACAAPDVNLVEMVKRTQANKVNLPYPVSAYFTKSVATVIADMGR